MYELHHISLSKLGTHATESFYNIDSTCKSWDLQLLMRITEEVFVTFSKRVLYESWHYCMHDSHDSGAKQISRWLVYLKLITLGRTWSLGSSSNVTRPYTGRGIGWKMRNTCECKIHMSISQLFLYSSLWILHTTWFPWIGNGPVWPSSHHAPCIRVKERWPTVFPPHCRSCGSLTQALDCFQTHVA